MRYLVFATIIWAFSFSLIGVYLAGQVDPYFSVVSRIALAAIAFIPFVRIKGFNRTDALLTYIIGAIQLGGMYLFYYHSFNLLTVPEVLIFTIVTPLYVTLFYDLAHQRFSPVYLLLALLSVVAAYVIRQHELSDDYWLGFFIVQGSNLCFALGQVAFKLLSERRTDYRQQSYFIWFYLGALSVALIGWFSKGQPVYPTSSIQWAVIIWLGIVASGLGYYLWNKGATLVTQSTLSIMNNMLIPAGLLVNLVIWNRDVDLIRLSYGGAILLFTLGLDYAYRYYKTN